MLLNCVAALVLAQGQAKGAHTVDPWSVSKTAPDVRGVVCGQPLRRGVVGKIRGASIGINF